jgi:hypothetical protein
MEACRNLVVLAVRRRLTEAAGDATVLRHGDELRLKRQWSVLMGQIRTATRLWNRSKHAHVRDAKPRVQAAGAVQITQRATPEHRAEDNAGTSNNAK